MAAMGARIISSMDPMTEPPPLSSSDRPPKNMAMYPRYVMAAPIVAATLWMRMSLFFT